MATRHSSHSPHRLSLRLVLIARLLRSRADALAFALAELQRPTARTSYTRWLADFLLTHGGNPEAMIAAAPDSLRAIFRCAYALPELALVKLPTAEALYGLLAAGYTTVPVPERQAPVARKSSLYMQILEPAGSNQA